MTPHTPESSLQALLRLALPLVPSLLSPWRPRFPFGIILYDEALPSALAFLLLLIPGGFIYPPLLFGFSAIIRDRAREGSYAAVHERASGKEAGANPNEILGCVSLREWPFPPFLSTCVIHKTYTGSLYKHVSARA